METCTVYYAAPVLKDSDDEVIALTSAAHESDRLHNVVTPVLQQLAEDNNKWPNVRHILFTDGTFDIEATTALMTLLVARPNIERITFGPDASAALAMNHTNLSDIVKKRPVLISGCLHRAMGKFEHLRTDPALQSSLGTFDPASWSYDWAAEDEVLPVLPNVTNADHPIIDCDSGAGIFHLRDEDEDGLKVTWGVRAANLKTLLLDTPWAFALAADSAVNLKGVTKLSLRGDQGTSEREVAGFLSQLTNLKELHVEHMLLPRLMNILAALDVKMAPLELHYSFVLDSRTSTMEMVPDQADSVCKSLNLKFLNRSVNGRTTQALDIICSSFANLQKLDVAIEGQTYYAGDFLKNASRRLTSLAVDWGTHRDTIPARAVVSALNDLEDLSDLTLVGWPLGMEVISGLARSSFRILKIPNSEASPAGLRCALSKVTEELDIGLRIMRHDDTKKVADYICHGRGGLRRLILRTRRAPDLKRLLEGRLSLTYSFMPENGQFLVIHF
jgi:hypothetical protein